MSKYNLTDIHKGIIQEGMGRGGTIKDSFYNIANLADDIDGQNIGKDTYPIYVQRLGPSSDDKTHEEFAIRYGEGRDDRFNIYDYKFGEDPTDEDNYQNDYPFSLGIPTGNKDAKQWAEKLGFEVSDSMFEDKDPKHADGTPKSNDEMTDDEREDYYMNLDSVDESKEDLDESPNLDALAKKLGMSVEDLAAKVAKSNPGTRAATFWYCCVKAAVTGPATAAPISPPTIVPKAVASNPERLNVGPIAVNTVNPFTS